MPDKIYLYHPNIGADVELFLVSLKDKNKVIEAGKIIPKEGLKVNESNKCTIDGVQVELNPHYGTCREGAGSRYKTLFKRLVEHCQEQEATISTTSVVHFSKKELDELSNEAKTFGCAPSINLYTNDESKIKVNPNVYGYRSAGGHIHLGLNESGFKKEYKLIVNLLDIILGNTCVMIDRDDKQRERRKVYGRAGEYRLPKWGVEYRALSNFWINNYHLMSMVYGFARLATSIAYSIWYDEKANENYHKVSNSKFRVILDKSDNRLIEEAINNNDFELAKHNWDIIKESLMDIIPDGYFGTFPICKDYLKEFEHFIDKGLEYWFKSDCLTHWTKELHGVGGLGWESFLIDVVRADIVHNGKIKWGYNNTDGSYTRYGFNVTITK